MYEYSIPILGAVVGAAAADTESASATDLRDQPTGTSNGVSNLSTLKALTRSLQRIEDDPSNDFLISSPLDMPMQGRGTEQTDTKICELMQGVYNEGDDGCKICPIDSPDRECCVYDLKDFSFTCEKCLVVDGQEVCGQVDCINDGESQTISCNGCTSGDSSFSATSRVDNVLSGGDVCVDFTCPSQGRCTCNAASLGGRHCHSCDIDGGKMPVLSCAATSAAETRRSAAVHVAATSMVLLYVFVGFGL